MRAKPRTIIVARYAILVIVSGVQIFVDSGRVDMVREQLENGKSYQ